MSLKYASLSATLLLIGSITAGADAAPVVGRTAGEFAVTATGAATYRIPITVAAGQNGMKPDIALAYNSRRGDGLAGVGWTITGLSQITRCGLRPALDGKFQGVRFTQEDRLCLDGQPLIQVGGGGGYWSGYAEYRLEVHNYEKIKSFCCLGEGSAAGPAWFEVEHRDGLTYVYGLTADSLVYAVGNPDQAFRVWALNEIRDPYGTRIFFSYEQTPGSAVIRPAEIKWSARAGETADNARYRLKFHYEDRPAAAKRSGYIWGSSWRREKRLKYIDYDFKESTSFARVHRYTLNYGTPANGSGRSVLANVQQCGPGPTPDCLPPTTFDSYTNVRGWQPDVTPVKPVTYPFEDAVPGDFNGDGLQDLFIPHGTWNVLLGTRNVPGAAYSDFEAIFSTGLAGVTPEATRVIDYNGDGRSDLLSPDAAGTNWHVYQSDGTTMSDIDIGVPKSEFTDPIVMDINGDGLDDILYKPGDFSMRARINNGNGFDDPTVAVTGLVGLGVDWSDQGGAPDFDGDGRDDYYERWVCVGGPCPQGYHIRYYRSNGTGLDYAGYISPNVVDINVPSIRAADINGDGLSDLTFLGFTATTGWTWYTVISKGWGMDTPVDTTIPYPLVNPNFDETPYTFADYDMDGRDDLVVGTKGAGGGWTVYPSEGTSFASTGIALTGVAPPNKDAVFALDIGGTGYPSLVYADSWPRLTILGHSGENPEPQGPDVLVSVTDGLGNYFNINSRPVTRYAGFPGSSNFPDVREFHDGSFYVVHKYTTNDGTGPGSYTIDYQYAQPRQDMRGRGFLGFARLRIRDSRDGTFSWSYIHQDFPLVGRVAIEARWSSVGDPITQYELNWDKSSAVASSGDTFHIVHLKQSPATASVTTEYEVDPDGGGNGQEMLKTTRKLTYDFSDGAINWDETKVESPAHGTVFTTTVDTTFKNFASRYCLGFPERIDVTKSDSVGPGQTRTVQYGYNAQCNRISETEGPDSDSSQQLVTTYGIDAQGKLTSIIRDSGDGLAANRKTTIGWDTIGGYRPVLEIAEITGQTNLTVGRSWDYELGLEASRTDPRGQTTVWNYDDFGRLQLETRPGPATTTVTIEACASCWAPAAQYRIRSLRSDGFWGESFHDSYGRVVGRSSVVLADTATNERRVTTAYDAFGRVISESIPYLAPATPDYVTYAYDLRGRIKVETRPHDDPQDPVANTYWTYNKLTVTRQDALGNTTSYLHDAAGRLIETQAPLTSGTQNAYWPFGELKTITQGGVAIKSLTYDARGFPDTVTDVDSGTWDYDYSVFGELVRQTDDVSPTPNTITMFYDQLGRPDQRIEAEGNTDWVYHQTGYGLGLLDEITGPRSIVGQSTGSCTENIGYCEKYTYDLKGRLEQTKHKIAGTSYVTNYGYNDDSQITSMTYPAMLFGNRYTFVYTYAHGHLDTIAKDLGSSTQPIYDVVYQDAFGNEELTKLFGTFGSGVTEYDHERLYSGATGRIRSIKTGVSPLGTNAQHYAYVWGKEGDLRSRQDNAQGGLTEEFQYDGLHRLDKIFINGVETTDIDYYANGNIQSKPDVGTYNYAGLPGSRAVTSITAGPRPKTYHYDANGNMDCRGDSTVACTNGDSIEWTSFNKPKQINYGNDHAQFDYGPDRHRIQQLSRLGTSWRRTHYFGTHFELQVEGIDKIRWQANIFANGRVIYQIIEHRARGACSSQMGSQGYHVLRDHQDSVDVLLNNGTSNDFRYSFDAFGKRRNGTGWTADTSDTLMSIIHATKRGYTGHEHLDNVRLIHMNGRVQDPVLGRMISPDPLLGDVRNPQSLNSYSYVMNNPMSLVDPSGFDATCPADAECLPLKNREGNTILVVITDFDPNDEGGVVSFKQNADTGEVLQIGVNKGWFKRLRNSMRLNSMAVQNPFAGVSFQADISNWRRVSKVPPQEGGSLSQWPAPGEFIKAFGGVDGALGFGGEGDLGAFVGRDLDGNFRFGLYVEYGQAYGYALSTDFGVEQLTGLNTLDDTRSINITGTVMFGSGTVNVNPDIPVGQPGRISGGGVSYSAGPLLLETFFSTTLTRTIVEFGGPD